MADSVAAQSSIVSAIFKAKADTKDGADGFTEMKQEQFETMFSLIVMALLVRVSYELSRPKSLKTVSFLVDGHLNADTLKQTSMTALQKEWAEKAVKRYAIAQEKKWLKWTEAMFKPNK